MIKVRGRGEWGEKGVKIGRGGDGYWFINLSVHLLSIKTSLPLKDDFILLTRHDIHKSFPPAHTIGSVTFLNCSTSFDVPPANSCSMVGCLTLHTGIVNINIIFSPASSPKGFHWAECYYRWSVSLWAVVLNVVVEKKNILCFLSYIAAGGSLLIGCGWSERAWTKPQMSFRREAPGYAFLR